MLQSAAIAEGVQPGGFNENILLAPVDDNGDDGGGGSSWWPPPSGTVLQVGDDAAAARLRITFVCEPCAKGAAKAGADFAVWQRGWKQRASRGVLATVLSSGTVRVGDPVVLLLSAARYAPLAADSPGRVRAILAKMPPGKVITYSALAALAGSPPGFPLRGMPGLLKKARQEEAAYPVHRVVDSKFGAIPQHLPGQCALLEAEGVRICAASGKVLDLAGCNWVPTHAELYLDMEGP